MYAPMAYVSNAAAAPARIVTVFLALHFDVRALAVDAVRGRQVLEVHQQVQARLRLQGHTTGF